MPIGVVHSIISVERDEHFTFLLGCVAAVLASSAQRAAASTGSLLTPDYLACTARLYAPRDKDGSYVLDQTRFFAYYYAYAPYIRSVCHQSRIRDRSPAHMLNQFHIPHGVPQVTYTPATLLDF